MTLSSRAGSVPGEDSSANPKRLRRRSDSNSNTSSSSSSSGSFILIASALYEYVRKRNKKQRTRRRSFFNGGDAFWKTVSFRHLSTALGPDLFRSTCRMSVSVFKLLLNKVRDLLSKPFKAATPYRRCTIPAEVRLAITLRMLAGSSYLNLILAYHVEDSTVKSVFHSTCEALMSRLCLKGFPKTDAGLKVISTRFQSPRRRTNPLPGCVGALDGICIKIKKPASDENPAMFYSRKGFYALPVQALVDSNYIFRFCSAVCTGATHDSLAFSVSGLKRAIDSGALKSGFYIVGDEAYSCTEFLITPYSKSNADEDQDNFNFYQSSLRMHVEQAFGMLVARWRILRGGLQYSGERSTNIVCLLMKLHNLILENDRERSVLVHHLTSSERDVIEREVNEWCAESREVAREFQESRGPVREHEVALQPVVRDSASSMRERLVQVVRDKGKERPDVVLLPYSVDRET